MMRRAMVERALLSPWWGTIVAAALTLVGQAGFVLLDRWLGLSVELQGLRAVHALVAAVVLVLASSAQRATRQGFGRVEPGQLGELATDDGRARAAFLVLALLYVPIFWLAESEMHAGGRLWAPFAGHKLVMIGIALLAPGRTAFGGALIAAIALEGIVTWDRLELQQSSVAVAAGEPWVTITYALVATVLLVFRDRHRRVLADYERATAEAASLEELARVILALRDTRNTPLQTLELAGELLEQGDVDPGEVVPRMTRAVARLREQDHLLSRYERWTVWTCTEESPDLVLRELEARLSARERRPS